MALTVRSLLPKVFPYRKDLLEDDAIFAIQETVRKICRLTQYAQTTVSASTVASTSTVDLSSLVTEGSVFRVIRVRRLDTTTSAYRILDPVNFEEVNALTRYRDDDEGTPYYWTQKSGSTIELYPVPDAIYTLEVTTSYIPEGEIETIPLPDESEDAIVAGAISHLLMRPGMGQNLGLAKDREVLFNREADALKASAMFGLTSKTRVTGRPAWR